IVDGAHAFAHLDFKRADLGCDYFCASLHKWLCAPKGTGFLFVRREKIESVWPLMAAEPDRSADIRKFEETGTRSAATRLAIGEALRFHTCVGGARKEARLRLLRERWTTPLSRMPNVRFPTGLDEDAACGIATVGIDGVSPEALQSHLFANHSILTVAIAHDQVQGIRVTPNVYTTLAELDRFVGVMEQTARHGLPK
ncbi:MAG TPA: aminotransferase class V-fold PLP-dependent enzyme, partial [Spirochaetia bacterium]|nr:aminotransferase class V-fold PLP-dependent enzyme [Spirochaetia bacterium]